MPIVASSNESYVRTCPLKLEGIVRICSSSAAAALLLTSG